MRRQTCVSQTARQIRSKNQALNITKLRPALAEALEARMMLASVQYTLTDLGAFPDLASVFHPAYINDSGQVVINSGGQAFLYSDGHASSLGAFEALGIDDDGEVLLRSNAGLFFFPSHDDSPALVPVSLAGATEVAMNAKGQILGLLPDGRTGVLNDHGTISFHTLAGSSVDSVGFQFIDDMNNSGQITGLADYLGDNGISTPFRSSIDRLITKSDLFHDGDTAEPVVINNNGDVAGQSFIYTDAGGFRPIALSPSDINDDATVVGLIYTGGGGFHAGIYTDQDGAADLNSLTDSEPGWVLTRATGINNQGEIVGVGINPEGVTHGFLLSLDPDDEISERGVTNLGDMTKAAEHDDVIVNATDVDLYAFSVKAGQRVSFDVDPAPKDGIDNSYLRLFDSVGAELASNDDGPTKLTAPREDKSKQAYLEYRFTEDGTYYIGVSSTENQSYDAVTGAQDTAGSVGGYTLAVVPMTQLTSPTTGMNKITGKVEMPNRESHRESVDVFLQRVSATVGTAATILSGVQTWVVAHGRADSSDSFQRLASAIDRYKAGDQVLVLDWAQGAADNGVGLDGAEWIPYVAQWAADVLAKDNIAANLTVLIGHSWGTYLVHDIAADTGQVNQVIRPRAADDAVGKVRGIVALDPAYKGKGYTDDNINFRRVSTWSWAFYGNGLFGSRTLALTATESFILDYDPALANPFPKHSAPVILFTSLVEKNNAKAKDKLADAFNLANLENATPGPWVRSATGFDGTFELRDTNGNGQWGDQWDEVLSFTYTDSKGKSKRL